MLPHINEGRSNSPTLMNTKKKTKKKKTKHRFTFKSSLQQSNFNFFKKTLGFKKLDEQSI